MGHSTSDSWFTISLNETFTVLPDTSLPLPSSALSFSLPASTPASSPASSSSSSSVSSSSLSTSSSSSSSSEGRRSESDLQQDHIHGTIVLRLNKPSKIKSLSITFSGVARTSFPFNSSSIPTARPCVCHDKNNYSCMLVEQRRVLLTTEGNSKIPQLLPSGTHRLSFSFPIHSNLPPTVSSRAITISYQVTASLQFASLLPLFASPHHISKPVVLLQREELPSDELFDTTLIHVATKESTPRLSSQVSIPCGVFPQAGTIPLLMNLSLQGNATTVEKITIELMESIYAIQQSSTSAGAVEPVQCKEVLVDERLVTRQNCPLKDWPSSTALEPVVIPKRLMFKVPQLPLTPWSSSTTSSRLSLGKGFCHTSGMYPAARLRISHSIRLVIQIKGLGDVTDSSSPSPSFEYSTAESEIPIWVVGNQDYREDETNPPSYYRSFSNTLVDGNKICEMDQRAIEALQDDISLLSSGFSSTLLPPCYEESVAGGNCPPEVTTNSHHLHHRQHLIHGGRPSSWSVGQGQDTDPMPYDLAAYTQRYSHANPTVLAV